MKALADFERGQSDYRMGLRHCPFTVLARVEAWRDGWLTEQVCSDLRAAIALQRRAA